MAEGKYPLHIRNVRYVPYTEIIAAAAPILILSALIVRVRMVPLNFNNTELWWIVILGEAFVIGFGVFLLSNQLVRQDRFGKWLTLEPSAFGFGFGAVLLKATLLRRLVYMADPQQDYADDLAERVVLVNFERQRGRLLRFYCRTADLEHLSTWANANGVPISDQRERRDV